MGQVSGSLPYSCMVEFFQTPSETHYIPRGMYKLTHMAGKETFLAITQHFRSGRACFGSHGSFYTSRLFSKPLFLPDVLVCNVKIK